MQDSIISLIAFIVIIIVVIGYGSFYYFKKWKKKEEKEIHSKLSSAFRSDYFEALKGNDRKKAIELGLYSVYYQFRLEELSYDTRLSLALDFFKNIIEETNKMKSDKVVPIEEMSEIFKKVTHMNVMWDASLSND